MILAPDGTAAACYLPEAEWRARGLDLTLGRLDSDGVLHADPAAVARVRRLPVEKPRCEACFCRWSCAGGCHINHSFPGHPRAYDDFCIQTRLVAACRLLVGLDQAALAEALLADRRAAGRLALWPDDRLRNPSPGPGSA